MPLQRRVPKFGFKNINRIEYQPINLNVLQALADTLNVEKIGIQELVEAGKVKAGKPVKILANGELNAKLEVEANAFSAKAEQIIVEKGGKVVKL